MTRPTTVDVLNRLLALHHRSLPQYLCSAQPWCTSRDEQADRVLRQLAQDQRLMVERIGSAVLSAGGRPELGEFPMSFTSLHDLSLGYLLGEVDRRLQQDISVIRECVAQLQHAPGARVLAEEALGAAEGHLQNLQEVMRPTLSVVSP